MIRRIHVFPGELRLAREFHGWGLIPDDAVMVALQNLRRSHPNLSPASFVDAAQLARALAVKTGATA